MLHYKRKAFTVVEMVIVIVIIAILATVAVPTFSTIFDTADKGKLEEEAKAVYAKFIFTANKKDAGEPAVFVSDGNYVVMEDGKIVGIFDTE